MERHRNCGRAIFYHRNWITEKVGKEREEWRHAERRWVKRCGKKYVQGSWQLFPTSNCIPALGFYDTDPCIFTKSSYLHPMRVLTNSTPLLSIFMALLYHLSKAQFLLYHVLQFLVKSSNSSPVSAWETRPSMSIPAHLSNQAFPPLKAPAIPSSFQVPEQIMPFFNLINHLHIVTYAIPSSYNAFILSAWWLLIHPLTISLQVSFLLEKDYTDPKEKTTASVVLLRTFSTTMKFYRSVCVSLYHQRLFLECNDCTFSLYFLERIYTKFWFLSFSICLKKWGGQKYKINQ